MRKNHHDTCPRMKTDYVLFRSKLTNAEAQALFEARRTDWRVEDFITLLAASMEMAFASPTLARGRTALIAAGVLTEQRAAQVFV